MKLSATLVCGMSGSGKTTFALRYLVARRDFVCRFVFDADGEFSERTRLPAARTAAALESSLATRWVVFDPSDMFPGRLEAAFDYFATSAFEAAGRGPGPKVLFIDEAWRWCNPHTLPNGLALVLQTGRRRQLETVLATQRPHLLNGSAVGQVTEVVAFRLQEERALEKVEFLGISADQVGQLPPGEFLALNTVSGGRLSGRVF